ncbi:TPA: trans-aconitate 2-methyltransferase [Kluyvera ascorbata]|nr:trans-aconitate 2-methyltransferase [Kluyvera ascorbata]
MSDWNPTLYMQFGAERSRPAAELLARIPLNDVASALDLGCGPGNSTALLYQRWPNAAITGIDTSPAMLSEARNALPECHFIEADIRSLQPEIPPDLIYANASLQWLSDHDELFPRLISLLKHNGFLAVQMPYNWEEPSHVLMREVAKEQGYPNRGRDPLPSVHRYYDILSQAGSEVDIWRTTYYHKMNSHQAIIDWVSATGLRPWLQDLDESQKQQFLARYHQRLQEHYPVQQDGQILLAFPRLFIVAQRKL